MGVVWKKGKGYLSIKVRVTSLYKKALHLYTKKGLNPCMSKTNLPVQVTVTFLYMYM